MIRWGLWAKMGLTTKKGCEYCLSLFELHMVHVYVHVYYTTRVPY